MGNEYDWRMNRVLREMEKQELDGLLAFANGWRKENVRYLTGAGLRGAFAFVYVSAQGTVVAFAGNAEDTDAIKAAQWITDVRPIGFPHFKDLILTLSDDKPRRLGIANLELLPVSLLQLVRNALPNVETVSASSLMNQVRLVKSEWELEQIRHAGVICSAGWETFVNALKPGVMEYEIVAAVEAEMKRLGAEDNFMLFASGGAEVMGMTPPGNRRLQIGDMVRTELTPQFNGYWAQICRSAVLGPPNEGQLKSFEIFKEALEAGLAAVHAGATGHDIARAENDIFRKYGYGEYCTSQYTRVRGHGHGLYLDEIPMIVEGSETVLEENSVIIVHPNTYTPLAGYYVLGDPVVVKKDGYELLLTMERKLFTVPA
ncbi:M24 family metallopeptidase [Alicyclobacillus kakegawensis]|uniref:M24 family metallopeptidase n=1 Tax=Alicyclobacillus kakegawensis TaxID=392012 RepID=UPI00082D0CB4|nr:Xaa-Pro peptidase family protein [Alicyclobacillus kakegawensis]